jgi:hypothetical protein
MEFCYASPLHITNNSMKIMYNFWVWVWVWVWVSYATTDSHSASLSWNKAPIWGLRQNINYCLTITVLFLWGALSDERTGQSFVHATGPRQRSASWVRVPLFSWPYFTVSDSRFPFSSPPTTRRVTVEVFDPASTRFTYNFYHCIFLYTLESDHYLIENISSVLLRLCLATSVYLWVA